MDELRAKATLYKMSGMIPVLDVDHGVLKSDVAIPTKLKRDLKRGVQVLEMVSEHQKDWHPGSDEKVLDLVHPSLFPLVYEQSRILTHSTIGLHDCLESISKGDVIPDPMSYPYLTCAQTPELYKDLWSTRFQWLPCDVSFPDGENARIDSYINNLHPTDHEGLYHTIEEIITLAVPFFNLACQMTGLQRISCQSVNWNLPPGVDPEPPADFDGHEENYYDEIKELRIYDRPEPEAFENLAIISEEVDNKFHFLGEQDKKLQIIVKLANIQLTPEKSSYEGGSWHIEGQLNERIVATAIYYYDNDNITDSYLSFRTKVESQYFQESLDYEQGDSEGIKKIFGIENDSKSTQEVGSVLTREDRLVVFPNGFQHRVGSFKLADPMKPGHRKILALFLVAPDIPIISTANVPPQRRDWWLREVKARESRISRLPSEIIDLISEQVDDFPIGLAEAKKLREELMTERGMMDKNTEKHMLDYNFSFCEH